MVVFLWCQINGYAELSQLSLSTAAESEWKDFIGILHCLEELHTLNYVSFEM